MHRLHVMALPMVLAALSAAEAADDDLVRTRQVADFEGDDWARGWELPGRQRDDWGEGAETEMQRSTEWASSGSSSLKLTFHEWEKGEGDWRVINFRPPQIDAGDWRGWDGLQFEAQVMGEGGVQLHVLGGGVEDPNQNRLFSFTIRSGQWRVSLRNDAMGVPDPDLSQIILLRFTTRQNRERRVIYLDNFRLVDACEQRLARLRACLDAAAEIAGPELRDRVLGLAGRAEGLAASLGETREPGPRLELRDRLAELTGEAREALSSLARATLVDAVDALTGLSLPAEEPELVTPLDAPPTVAADAELRALEGAVAAVERRMGAARVEAEMQRQFPDAPLAIGIPKAPETLSEFAADYAGPFGREVRIAAARREYEPFQLVILARDRELTGVRVEASALRGPGAIAPENIEVAPMGWRPHPADGVHYADMLRPDVRSFDVGRGGLQPVWVNVYVPPGTPPGDYSGTVTISAESVEPQEVHVHLTVWPFTLPKYASLQTATHGWGHSGEWADANAWMVISHRFNAMSIYQWPDPPPLDDMLRWHEWGANLFNLKRISRMGSGRFEEGPDGQPRFTDSVRNDYLRRVDKRIKQVRDRAPWLLDHLVLYGFDELGSGLVPALEDIYGEFKRRYPRVRTMTTVNVPLWEDYERIEHLDIIAVVTRLLSPEVRDRLRAQGMQVWWYNLRADQRDEVLMRAQYWATMRDDLDGVLHWSLSAGGGVGPYGEGLWPEPGSREEDSRRFTWGGLIRRAPDGRPLSTVAFEYWREGMEDCDYLALLRDLLGRAEALPADVRVRHAALLRRAEEMAAVPKWVTTGMMEGGFEEELPEAVREQRHTDDMQVILGARHSAAELIVELQKLLADPRR
ncbi:MAG: glycoside hydrolase domain-containing protein [Armatimonadota bacterium]